MRSAVTVILNSASGSGDTNLVPQQVAESLASHGIDATIELTPGHAIQQTTRRALDAGSDIIVAAGGDGTVSGVSAVVAGTGALLGIVSLGTLNHFARDVGIPPALADAVRTIAQGHSIAVDVGEAGGGRFINNFSVGLYPSVVREREQRRKAGRRKSIAFALAMLQVWREYRRVSVILEEGNRRRIVRTPFVFVGNNEYRLEGVRLGGRDSLRRGHLHVAMAPEMTRAEVVGVLLSSVAGRLRQVDHFESFQTMAVSIDALRKHLTVSLDGELAVVRTPIHFRVLPAALRVLVPEPEAV